MPLYAYIKIPGVVSSESTDKNYDKTWIPLYTFDLHSAGNEEDSMYKSKKERLQKQRDLAKKLAKQSKLAAAGETKPLDDEKAGTLLKKTDDDDDEQATSGGNVVIRKTLDATSPKLHELCLNCLYYKSDQYIDGQIEVHICRQIPAADGSGATSQAYVAYILKKCLITELGVEGSDNSQIAETLKISFEEIYSCIRTPNKTWDVKGWNFVNEKEKSDVTPSQPG